MLTLLFNDKAYELLNFVYPNKYKPWELKSSQVYDWSESLIQEALHWLFEEKLNWTENELRENFNKHVIARYNLLGLMNRRFNGSPFKLLDYYFPNRLNPWEMNKSIPWTDEAVIKGVKWLFEVKLNWTIDDIKNKATIKILQEHGFATIVSNYNGNLHAVLEKVYPNVFLEWDLRRLPKGYYEKVENRSKIVKHLLTEKLKWTKEECLENFNITIFRKNGFGFFENKTDIDELISFIQEIYKDNNLSRNDFVKFRKTKSEKLHSH